MCESGKFAIPITQFYTQERKKKKERLLQKGIQYQRNFHKISSSTTEFFVQSPGNGKSANGLVSFYRV